MTSSPFAAPGRPEWEEKIAASWQAVLASAPADPGAPEVAADDAGKPQLPASCPKIIVVSGRRRAGKDVAAEHLAATYAGVRNFRFSTAIAPYVNRQLQGTGHRITEHNKTHPPYRQLLEDVGFGLAAADELIWVREVVALAREHLASGAQLVVITGARLPQDLHGAKELGASLWRIVRPGNPDVSTHPVELALDDVPDSAFDEVIVNHVEGDLRPYIQQVEQAIRR